MYLDGPNLVTVSLSSLRSREIYKIPQGFQAGRGIGVAEDGLYAALVEKSDRKTGCSL